MSGYGRSPLQRNRYCGPVTGPFFLLFVTGTYRIREPDRTSRLHRCKNCQGCQRGFLDGVFTALAQGGPAVCLTQFSHPEPAPLYFTFCQDLQGLFGNRAFHGDMGVVIRDIDFSDLLARQIGISSQGA